MHPPGHHRHGHGHGRRPGLLAVVAMALVLILANGVPGVANESPSAAWTTSQIEQRLAADSVVTPTVELHEDQAIVAEVRAAARRRAAVERRRRGTRRAPARRGPFVRDYRKVALYEARRAHIRHPWMFVRQMAAESGMQPCSRSGAGAIGIAQIMPGTARSWRVDPHIPESALRAAAQHMRRYEVQYGNYRLALAAYNAGPGAVQAAGGVPPYAETREYIRRVMDRSYPLPGMRQVFRLPGGLQSGFAPRLRALQRDVRRHGGRLRINEGWRSYEDQVRVWRLAKHKYGSWSAARRWAAAPGCSNHGRGWAADLGGSLTLAHQLAGRHHLVFPMSHEPWHVELAGIPTQSG